MHAFTTLASLALLAAHVHASIYVTNPVQATQCAGGQSCQVQWVDNGEAPLLPQIGQCNVALYTGEYQLVQSLQAVDVSATSSFSFTPDPAAGPNGQYYIVFTSNAITYTGFSASFSLTGMTGTTGGSSTGTPATTSGGLSTSTGSTTSGTIPSGSATLSGVSTLSGTSDSSVTTPTVSTSALGTGTGTVTIPTTPATITRSSTSTTPTTTSTSSTSASPTPSNAAVRVGSSMSLGGLAALLALSGVIAF